MAEIGELRLMPRLDMRTLKLAVAYDGTDYVGWQRQVKGVSVQGLIEEALAHDRRRAGRRVHGAGRTDAGVHALGQVASATRSTSPIEDWQLIRARSTRTCPPTIRVHRAVDASPAAFTRGSAPRRRPTVPDLERPPVPPFDPAATPGTSPSR